MASVEDDVVVQTLPSNRADDSLGIWILPRTSRCCENFLDANDWILPSNLSTVPAVAIAEEIRGRRSVRERLYDLLCSPSSGGMLTHIEMQHLATVVFQENEYEQHFIVIVGTVKKPMETIWPTWLCRKVRHVW
jgi:hypothetical protein